jgi:hypothetical protein
LGREQASKMEALSFEIPFPAEGDQRKRRTGLGMDDGMLI